MTPVEIIADPIEFHRWWQQREPHSQDRQIRNAATIAGLITTQGGLIVLTTKGRAHRRQAYVGQLSPKMRRALAAKEREKARDVED